MKKKDYELTEHNHDKINWFPGHMNKALQEIKKRLKMVNLVIEVRDARSPLVTGNPSLEKILNEKARLVIFNKADLTKPDITKEWDHFFHHTQPFPYLFVGEDMPHLKKEIVQKAREVVRAKQKQSGFEVKEKEILRMMMIGLPNTGKSSLINRLAERQASKVADKPGHTQRQQWVKVDQSMELLDTPGVMPPHIKSREHGLWLAALHAIPNHIVAPEDSACFIIKYLLDNKQEKFFEVYNLPDHLKDLIETLDTIAQNRGCLKKKAEYDYDRVYHIVLNDFRSGKLGLVNFGRPPKQPGQ